MKELPRPWNNWHSELVSISPLVVPVNVANEQFFQQRKSAALLEDLIKGGFQNYYTNWLRARFERDGSEIRLTDVDQMLRRLTTNTTVNFRSTQIPSDGTKTSPPNRDIDGIPNDFFLWDSILNTLLGVDYTIPLVQFQRADYDSYLSQHKFRLVQQFGSGPIVYEQQGSTYFAFFVPVPALEDQYVLTQLRSAQILPDKFIASVLMVDFQNPVFSAKRATLDNYAAEIKTGTINNGVSSVPADFAAKVESAAAGQAPCDPDHLDQCTAEQQFLFYWKLPDDQWKNEMGKRIQEYLDQIKNLPADKQLDELLRLSVKRRDQFTQWPLIMNLDEFSLLLPSSDISEDD
jgi:hypothetical protein